MICRELYWKNIFNGIKVQVFFGKKHLKKHLRQRFCEGFRTSYCSSSTNFKKPKISGKIVGFLKFVGEKQELVWKRSQKSNKHVILHYFLLSIYQLLFPKFCPIQKQQKNAKKLTVFGKNNSRR